MGNRKFFLPVTASLLLLAIVLVFFMAGRRLARQEVTALVRQYEERVMLGDILRMKKVRPEDIIPVYNHVLDAKAFDSICYDIPKIPTPFVGTAPRPGKFGNAYINQMQLRYHREIALPKPDSVFRIFITGGSVAFGSGAPSDATTISGYLGQILNEGENSVPGKHIEVISAACPAWCSTQERIWIENRLSEWAPDIIISYSGVNDIHWSMGGRNIFFFRTYWDHMFDMITRDVYGQLGMENYPDIITEGGPNLPVHVMVKRLMKNISQVNALAEKEQFKYLYVLQPSLQSGKKAYSPHEANWEKTRKKDKEHPTYVQDAYSAMNDTLSRIDHPAFYYFDHRSVFDTLPPGTPIFYDSYHFADRGNKVVAKSLAVKIREIMGDNSRPDFH